MIHFVKRFNQADPKLRQVYDKYGANGVRMMKSMGEYASFIDPDVVLSMNRIFASLTLIFALLIVQIALVAIKIEARLDWSWPLVFWPLFIVDGIVVVIFLSQTSSGDQGEEEAKQKPPKGLIAYVLLFVVFHILIALRLEWIIQSSWWIVFIPWFIMELVHLVLMVLFVVSRLDEPIFQESLTQETYSRPKTALEKFVFALSESRLWMLRVAQAILLIVKLDGADWSWTIVFIPFFFWGGLHLVGLVLDYLRFKKSTKPEERAQIIAQSIGFILMATLVFTSVGLLIKRLNSQDGLPPAATIMIPLFIVFGILFCCVCCCLPCAAMSFRIGLEEEMKSQNRVIVPVERRVMG